jgi:hypothetical protein
MCGSDDRTGKLLDEAIERLVRLEKQVTEQRATLESFAAENPMETCKAMSGVHIQWPLASGLPWEFVPPPPSSSKAFCSLLYGDSEQFFLYALHVASQLQRTGSCSGAEKVDMVLLVGPSRFFEEAGPRNALHAAGWTHLVRVDCINGENLSRARRHDRVFTKLRALSLPYAKVLFLDLDVHIRRNIQSLFEVPAPAGKYHWNSYACDLDEDAVLRRHGIPFPEQPPGSWCPNAGVLRLDPPSRADARRELVNRMEHEITTSGGSFGKNALPEQYYLAERLSGWHHISEEFNLELHTDTCENTLDRAAILHFSGKLFGTQPIDYLDVEVDEAGQHTRHGCDSDHEYPTRVLARACGEWQQALGHLCTSSNTWPSDAREFLDSILQHLRARAWKERNCHSGWWRPEKRRWPPDTSGSFYTYQQIVEYAQRCFGNDMGSAYAEAAWDMSVQEDFERRFLEKMNKLSSARKAQLLSAAAATFPQVRHWCEVALCQDAQTWEANLEEDSSNSDFRWEAQESEAIWQQASDRSGTKVLGDVEWEFPQWLWHCWRTIPLSMCIGADRTLTMARALWEHGKDQPT